MVWGGMQNGALTYNVFALSTLLYVGQLERVPEDVLQAEGTHVTRMFPGPGKWINRQDAWYFREAYGLAKSAQPLEVLAKAAQLRVATLGCHFERKVIQARDLRRLAQDNIFARTHELDRCISNTDHVDRVAAYHAWYEGNYCRTLCDNFRDLRSRGIHAYSIYRTLLDKGPTELEDVDVDKIRGRFQREVVIAIKAAERPQVTERIRWKLRRWRNIPYGLSGQPGRYCISIHRRLLALSKLVPPRVHAAVFHTLFNGWCTHRRMQRRRSPTNKCVFHCCENAEDSIEHYCRCKVVHRVSKHTLHMEYPSSMGLDVWALNSGWLDSSERLMGVGILIYGVYNAFNTLRYSPVTDSQQGFHCIVQHCKQGALGHAASMSFLDSRWAQPITILC